MRGTVRATGAAVHTPHDTTEVAHYPLGFWIGGTDQSEEGVIVVAWKSANGTDVTCTFRMPVGSIVPVEGFYKILSTGTTLPSTNGQVGYFYGDVRPRW